MIVFQIVEAFKTALTTAMIDNVPAGDPERAAVVKVGRFQDDPTIKPVYIAIQGGDPEKTEYMDGIVTLEGMENTAIGIYAREIGGGQYWWRRGIVQIGCYYVIDRFSEEVAMEHSYNVLGRVVDTLESTNLVGLTDEYNEKALMPLAFSSSFSESGGPPDTYIWRGKVHWSVLTERPRPNF